MLEATIYLNDKPKGDVSDDMMGGFKDRLEDRAIQTSPAMKYFNDYKAQQVVEEVDEQEELPSSIMGKTVREPEVDALTQIYALDAQEPVVQEPIQPEVDKPLLQDAWDMLPAEAQKIAWPFAAPFVKGAGEENPILRGMTEGALHDAPQGMVDLSRDVVNALGGDFKEEDWLKIPQILESNPDSTTEGVVRGLSQFMSIFGAAGGIGKGATIFKQMMAGGLADATFDPTGGNVATLLRELDMDNALTQFLDSKVGEDADALERLQARGKQVLEGAGIGFAIPTLIGGLRWAKNNAKDLLQDSDPNLVPGVMKKFGIDLPQKDIFAGGSAVQPPEGLEQAKAMLEGERWSPYLESKVWEKTGWHKLPDGNYAFEIDDSAAAINNLDANNEVMRFEKVELDKYLDDRADGLDDIIRTTNVGSGERLYDTKLGEVLDHEQLYKQYPYLRDMDLQVLDGLTNTQGESMSRLGEGASYNSISQQIQIYVDPVKGLTDSSLSSLVHEIQHAIQDKENWMNGGSASEQWIRRLKQSLWKDKEVFAKNKEQYKEDMKAYSYANKLKQVDYWDELSKRDSVTGIARHFYNTDLWYTHSDEITKKFGPRPKPYKKEEHNEYLKNVGAFYRDKMQDEVDDLIDIAIESRDIERNYDMINMIKSVDGMKQKDKVKAIERKLNENVKDAQEYRKIESLIQKVEKSYFSSGTQLEKKKRRHQIYEQLQGEWQARNAQARRMMSATERVEQAPYTTSAKTSSWGDVQREDVITTKSKSYLYGPGYGKVDSNVGENPITVYRSSTTGGYDKLDPTKQRNATLDKGNYVFLDEGDANKWPGETLVKIEVPGDIIEKSINWGDGGQSDFVTKAFKNIEKEVDFPLDLEDGGIDVYPTLKAELGTEGAQKLLLKHGIKGNRRKGELNIFDVEDTNIISNEPKKSKVNNEPEAKPDKTLDVMQELEKEALEYSDSNEFVTKVFKRQSTQKHAIRSSIAKDLGGEYSGNVEVPEGIANSIGDRGSRISVDGNDVYFHISVEKDIGGNDVIFLPNIAVSGKNKGLGTKFMEAMKKFADTTSQDIVIYKVTNDDFFRKFDWLEETELGGSFKYKAKKGNESLGLGQLDDIWKKAHSNGNKGK